MIYKDNKHNILLQDLITKIFLFFTLFRPLMNEKRDYGRLKEVGRFLKHLRLKSKLSQDQLAARCDLTKSNISNIENGKKDFNFSTFLEYARGLNKHPKELLEHSFDFTKNWNN